MYDEKARNEAVEYIEDWQKKTKKHQAKYNAIVLVAFIIAFVICIFFVIWFRNENYNRVVDTNMKYVQDNTIQEADHLEQRMEEGKNQIKKYAKQYAVLKENEPASTVTELLDILCDRTLFDRVSFITLDGNDITIQGDCDVEDREYFKKAVEGETGYEFLHESRITGKPVILFYSPVYDDKEICGILAGIYEDERIDNMLSYKFFNYVPDTYLVEGDGTVIANIDGKNLAKNIFEELEQKKYTGDNDFDGILDAIRDTERTSVTFEFKNGDKNTIGVLAQFEESDWMILSILPNEITDTIVTSANHTGGVLAAVIVAAMAVVGLLFLLFIKKRYNSLMGEMTLTANKLFKTTHHDQLQSFIVASLGNIYTSIYYADIENSKYKRIKEMQDSSLVFPEVGNLEDIFHSYVDNFVHKTYKEQMRTFMDLSTYEERLGDKEILSAEYLRMDDKWRKAMIIPAERNEDGRIKSAIFAVQKIEIEKQQELETQKALKEAYEAAQLANNAKTVFLSNMSHDIRTPMNAIVGMTTIAAANLGNKEKVSDCLKKITGASRHLLGLINEVLDMSKIESGRVELSDERFCLSDLIDELITMNQPLIRDKGHTLTVHVKDLTHEHVIGDSIRLQQVFTNLLTNAIKYTPDNGKLDITVTEKVTNKPNIGWYEVVFRDNGIGMSEEFRKKIFEPFSRAEDDRISNIQGTGLGMAIARNIVRMMNGDLTVESELNKGSAFTVTFALRLQNENSVDYSDLVDLPVLVVDDDISACESTCVLLNSLSMNSEWVDSGRLAVKRVKEHHEADNDYYAVIVDWKMPDMDGVETTRAIRREVGDEVPIIVLTAYDWAEIEEEAKEAGVNAFIGKPLFRSKLLDLFMDLRENSKPEKPQPSASIEEQDFSGKRILLAEDNELNREIAEEILSMMGLEVESAENGKICHEMFMNAKPGYYDMILMDIQMPVMNGYESAQTIRASKHPDAKRIPIVAMTANAFSTDVRAAFDAGMNGHISKPIEIANVVNALNENLRK